MRLLWNTIVPFLSLLGVYFGVKTFLIVMLCLLHCIINSIIKYAVDKI